jgi:uncharacterized protein YcbX
VTITVTDLFRYPVKSLRGDILRHATIGPRGIDGDRRWMIVDVDGRFITRRETPDMALFTVQSDGDRLLIDHPQQGSHHVARPDRDASVIDARIWGDTVRVRLTGSATDAYLSQAFGRPVRLVYQGDEGVRLIDQAFAAPGDHVSLSDGYPLLIVNQASLAALNAELTVPVPITRFRPNIVVRGAAAWAEDHWRRIRIGEVTFRIAKPCSRCIVTTQQPETGARLEGNEPLATLRQLGRIGKGGVMFGLNAVPESAGSIAIGDLLELVETGESNLR